MQAKDQEVQTLGIFGSVFNSGLVGDGMGGMIPDVSGMKAAVGQLEGTSFKREDMPKGSSTVINKVRRTNTGVIIDVTDIVIDETVDENGNVKTNKIEKGRQREVDFADLNNDDFVSILYTHIYGKPPSAEVMNAYRRSPGYSTIDQNKASQFMQNDGSGRTFISADEASNSQLPYFMQFMGGNANGNMNTGIGTSNATTGLNFANLPTGPTGATGPQGVTGPAGTSTP